MKSQKMWIVIAGISGFTGVALGAFGAHRLGDLLSAQMMDIYKTGVLYHLIHSVVILVLSLYGNNKFFKSALMFIIGIILFSFSLYLYAQSGDTTFAMITPVGGIFFLIGWLLLIVEGIRMKKV